MSKSTILVIFVATALALQVTAQPPTTPTYFLSFCRSKMGNYTNSTYQTNIQTVLVKLDDQSSTAQFSNATAGLDSGNQVFGQYYCRGDVNSSLCHDCVKQAADTIFTNCTHFKSAVVWYEECTLRYDNTSMVGVEAERPLSYAWSLTNVTDPHNLGVAVNKTMDMLINQTAYGDSLSFATGEGVVSAGNETVYCLAQCSPDLNGTECDTCLRDTYRDFVVPLLGSHFVKVFSPSCQLRYSMKTAFYSVTKANRPPVAAAPSPMTTSPSPSFSEQPPSPMTTSPSPSPSFSEQPPSPMTPPPPGLSEQPPSPMTMSSPSPSSPPAPVAIASPPPTAGSAKLKKEETLNLGLVISTTVFALLCFG